MVNCSSELFPEQMIFEGNQINEEIFFKFDYWCRIHRIYMIVYIDYTKLNLLIHKALVSYNKTVKSLTTEFNNQRFAAEPRQY